MPREDTLNIMTFSGRGHFILNLHFLNFVYKSFVFSGCILIKSPKINMDGH